jgi:hypothetical protein
MKTVNAEPVTSSTGWRRSIVMQLSAVRGIENYTLAAVEKVLQINPEESARSEPPS